MQKPWIADCLAMVAIELVYHCQHNYRKYRTLWTRMDYPKERPPCESEKGISPAINRFLRKHCNAIVLDWASPRYLKTVRSAGCSPQRALSRIVEPECLINCAVCVLPVLLNRLDSVLVYPSNRLFNNRLYHPSITLSNKQCLLNTV